MKLFISSLCLAMLCACASKENSTSSSNTSDSVETETVKEKNFTESPEKHQNKTPLDTIIVSYPNGKKLYLLVWEYYDINDPKLLKDFELKEIETNRLVFRPISSQFYAERIYNTGEIDFITIDPIYYISSKNPLEINLSFFFYGDFTIEYLEGLIGKVTYEKGISDNDQPRMNFDFLTYKLTNDENLKITSELQFIPKKCEATHTELLNGFNDFKNHVDIDNGAQLAKVAFICFLNGQNSQHKTMMEEFRKLIPQSEDIYDSYPYVEYLDKFIINLNP